MMDLASDVLRLSTPLSGAELVSADPSAIQQTVAAAARTRLASVAA
jgi:hypothetical protein